MSSFFGRQFIKKLHEIAMKDGVISDEEEALILSVISNYNRYTQTLEKAMINGDISENKKNELFNLRMIIMEDCYDTAREDLKISADEAILLKEICKIILKFSEA